MTIQKLFTTVSLSFLFASQTYANNVTVSTSEQSLAAPGSTQFIVVMNALANPSAVNLSKSDVMVKFYDGSGNNPPCWVADKITYHNDPYIAGAGGKNACGKSGMQPPAIVKIDVVPLKAAAGKIYNDLPGIAINPNQFYNGIIIEQETPPLFGETGELKIAGNIKVIPIVK